MRALVVLRGLPDPEGDAFCREGRTLKSYKLGILYGTMLRTPTEREFLPDVSYDGVPARPIPSSSKALCAFRTAFNDFKDVDKFMTVPFQ